MGKTPDQSELTNAQKNIEGLVQIISSYEPISLLIPRNLEKPIKNKFGAEVCTIAADYNDIWVRDTLPTFALDDHNSLRAIDWHFNGSFAT